MKDRLIIRLYEINLNYYLQYKIVNTVYYKDGDLFGNEDILSGLHMELI